MILVDTSVWVDHLRANDEQLFQLLDQEEVLIHPFVIGELALGNLPRRDVTLALLAKLPTVMIVADREVLHLIDRHRLFGLGIGFIDAHLLASAQVAIEDIILWTRDRRLAAAAVRIGLTTPPPAH